MRLTKEVIISFHHDLILHFGGVHGVRDINILDYISKLPYQTLNKILLYPKPIDKAAILGFALITKHPFLDGNKRIGMHTVAIYLRYYGFPYQPTAEEVVRVALLVASNSMDFKKFHDWIVSKC